MIMIAIAIFVTESEDLNDSHIPLPRSFPRSSSSGENLNRPWRRQPVAAVIGGASAAS
jgi:hypothetical protein